MTGNAESSLLETKRAVAPQQAIATLFTIPKPFVDPHIRLIQANALRSWQCLAPELQVVLCGDDSGVAQFADENGMLHVPDIRRNAQGTPLVNDAFERVAAMIPAGMLVYCNADVILFRDLLTTVQRLAGDPRFASMLAFGRRSDLELRQAVDLTDNHGVRDVLLMNQRMGRPGPAVCKEYFVVTRDLVREMPELAVGRGNWDNWMVAAARRRGVPVINTTRCITAIHQTHDYSHVGRSRLHCYVTGDEARANQRAAGGRNMIRGCCANWTMTSETIRRNRWGWMFGEFWSDLPAFLRLCARLPFQR